MVEVLVEVVVERAAGVVDAGATVASVTASTSAGGTATSDGCSLASAHAVRLSAAKATPPNVRQGWRRRR